MGTGFKQLKVWAEARDLAGEIYRLSSTGSLNKDFTLRDQMRRAAAVSIPSNIAEGDERDTDKDAVRFFYIAKGSIAELRTQLKKSPNGLTSSPSSNSPRSTPAAS